MIFFSIKNLVYNDYRWTVYQKNDPKVSGKPDQTPFDPKEGNEMVYMVNKLMTIWNYRFANTGAKIEKLIHDELPEGIVSQEEVQNWVQGKV